MYNGLFVRSNYFRLIVKFKFIHRMITDYDNLTNDNQNLVKEFSNPVHIKQFIEMNGICRPAAQKFFFFSLVNPLSSFYALYLIQCLAAMNRSGHGHGIYSLSTA